MPFRSAPASRRDDLGSNGPRPARSMRAALLAAVGVLTLTLGGSALLATSGTGPGSRSADGGTGPYPDVARGAPTTPPARICGSKELEGPATPPAGAREVSPSQDLSQLALRSPPGATFWLAPGVHTLGTGEYDQVGPKSGQTFIGAPGAILDGQHLNRYAFGGDATGVTIAHLTVQNFGASGDNPNEGVVNHDAGDRWRIVHNTIQHNAGAGVFIGDGDVVADNCLLENGQYGFSAAEVDGVRNVTLRHNEIAGNNTDDWEARQEGCGCTGGGKFWDTRNARIVDNWIHDNLSAGLWADTNNTEFLIKGNYISDNAGQGIIYETSYNAAIIDNAFVRNGLVDGPDCDCFPLGALYLSESGSDPRAGKKFGASFEVAGNRFVDNWSGIMAWENADRFAGSPNNTSTGYSTLVNPEVATVEACGDPDKIGTPPYVDDCRWKTSKLRIHDNLFAFTPSHLGSACTPSAGCGWMGLFSNVGSSPSWSPYQGEGVEKDLTFGQDNRWESNSYVGPWQFIVYDMGRTVGWETWRSSPYGQDRLSTMQ
ncbi:right-handed parallel beta-helix repeat-containing protein [Nocardioides koreensis]